MIYFDSTTRRFTNPDVARVFGEIISDPRFNHDRIPYFKKLGESKSAQQVLEQYRNKSTPTYPLLGPDGLDMAVCEWLEMGYGIFDGYTDGERLLSWLGPTFQIDQEKLRFRVTDWRARMANGVGSLNTWTCQPITSTDVDVTGCIFDYCFDWDRYYYASVPAGIKPSDTAVPCMVQYPINVFGQQLTDPIALRDWELLTKARLFMLDRLINGDWAGTPVGDAMQEDGIIHFFDNFAARQTNLEGYCLSEFSPITIPVTGEGVAAQMAMFVNSISSELATIEYRAKHLDGQAQIPFDQIAVIMNEWDAACITWYQACTTKCTSTFVVNDPAMIEGFWSYWQSQFTKGAYGGGTIRLSDGRELSIMQMEHMPRGTVVMLVKGWTGSRPNPYGMRVAAMQYSEYYRRLAATSAVAQMRFQLLMNGSMIKETPIDMCGDISLRWNQRLFSNAPWMQRRWTGFPVCTDFTAPVNWPALPAMPHYARCTPVGYLSGVYPGPT